MFQNCRYERIMVQRRRPISHRRPGTIPQLLSRSKLSTSLPCSALSGSRLRGLAHGCRLLVYAFWGHAAVGVRPNRIRRSAATETNLVHHDIYVDYTTSRNVSRSGKGERQRRPTYRLLEERERSAQQMAWLPYFGRVHDVGMHRTPQRALPPKPMRRRSLKALKATK